MEKADLGKVLPINKVLGKSKQKGADILRNAGTCFG